MSSVEVSSELEDASELDELRLASEVVEDDFETLESLDDDEDDKDAEGGAV